MEVEDDDMTIPTEHEWIPNAYEASDIEMEGVVETPEEEDNEELQLRMVFPRDTKC